MKEDFWVKESQKGMTTHTKGETTETLLVKGCGESKRRKIYSLVVVMMVQEGDGSVVVEQRRKGLSGDPDVNGDIWRS